MTTEDEFQLYKIDGSKVWLSPTAVEYAAQWFGPGRQGVRKMAEYLRMVGGESETAPAELPPEAMVRDLFPDVVPSENIEDRRGEHFVPDKTMQQIWGRTPHNVAPHAQTFGGDPLSASLGFRDIGQRPASSPQVLGPTAPQWPAAFGNYRPLPFD